VNPGQTPLANDPARRGRLAAVIAKGLPDQLRSNGFGVLGLTQRSATLAQR